MLKRINSGTNSLVPKSRELTTSNKMIRLQSSFLFQIQYLFRGFCESFHKSWLACLLPAALAQVMNFFLQVPKLTNKCTLKLWSWGFFVVSELDGMKLHDDVAGERIDAIKTQDLMCAPCLVVEVMTRWRGHVAVNVIVHHSDNSGPWRWFTWRRKERDTPLLRAEHWYLISLIVSFGYAWHQPIIAVVHSIPPLMSSADSWLASSLPNEKVCVTIATGVVHTEAARCSCRLINTIT